MHYKHRPFINSKIHKIYASFVFFAFIIFKKEKQIEVKKVESFWKKCLFEIKSTFYLEDWVASYLGVLGTALIIIIYGISYSVPEIEMSAWTQNPSKCFIDVSVWIVIVFAFGIIWVISKFSLEIFFFKINKNITNIF